MRLFILLLLFMSFLGGYAAPQDTTVIAPQKIVQYDTNSNQEPLSFDNEKLKEYKSNDDFNYSEIEVEENWWNKFVRWLGNLWSRFWNWVFDGVAPGPFWAMVIRVLPYLIIASVIVFVIWVFYKLNPGASIFKSRQKPEVFFTEEEEIIKSKNIHNLIDRAIQNKDYRLAVRYYYLLILKKLTESEVIDYEFDKTNTDYIAEITSEKLNLQFSKVTNLYDYIWYGSFAVTEEDYDKAQRTFTSLEQSIANIKPKAVE